MVWVTQSTSGASMHLQNKTFEVKLSIPMEAGTS